MEERPRRCRSHHTDPRNRTRGPGSGSRRGGRRRYGSLGPTGASGAPPAEASLPTEEPNFLAHAFKSQYNLIGLGTALGFAALSGTLFPLVIAAGVELIVLPLVSGNPRFQRLVRARVFQEKDVAAAERTQKEAGEMLRDLPNVEQQRYRALQGLASEIRQNYKALDSSSQMLVEELVRKLDFLLSFYLRMRYSLSRYHAYFSTTDPERIQERIAMLDHEIAEGAERVQQIKARTRVVLEKRL